MKILRNNDGVAAIFIVLSILSACQTAPERTKVALEGGDTLSIEYDLGSLTWHHDRVVVAFEYGFNSDTVKVISFDYEGIRDTIYQGVIISDPVLGLADITMTKRTIGYLFLINRSKFVVLVSKSVHAIYLFRDKKRINVNLSDQPHLYR